MERVFLESLLQTRTRFDFGSDRIDELCNGGIVVTLGDDLECLQQWHARFEHRRQLAGEQGDVFFADLAAAAAPLLLHLKDLDALPAQHHVHLRFATRAYFAPDGFSAPILADPCEAEIPEFRLSSRNGAGGH
jgi:hypothetical protein